ncbi:MAG: UvrD-helicase domain-containing protein [Bacteroides sp.]|nr:UvrD-helicase domain-containing protein [Ruminococcus flavefaciens]MCM1554985.1 UvrD-helicase domain-containing protein [Bacteroides sp.]
MSLLDSLNPEQRAAAEHIDGPVMIIAGAGSGKTRTLTYRIAHLMEQGCDPFRILALTFTNKAAREMRERITALVGPDARSLWMGTFHSIFAKILRAEAEQIGYQKTFGIYDTDDCKSLIKKIVKDFNLDPKQYKDSRVLYRISMAKNSLISAQYYNDTHAFLEEDQRMRMPETGRIFLEYDQRLRQASIMDFDDLLFNTNVLFRDFPETLQKYQKRFRYIMVDEYQDTNYAQYLIVKKLAAGHQNICVVGDDSQSIYSFRGANIQNILNFEHDYPQMKKFKLEQNYRSTGHIVQLSNSIIEHNKDRIPKEIWTDNEEGGKVSIIRSAGDKEEGDNVAHQIFQVQMNKQARPKDFAVLYRTNSQSKLIEDALRKLNIPYRIYGGLSFYRRKEIKDIIAYFRWVTNPKDEESLLRCINNPARGIGDTTLSRLRLLGALCGGGIWEGMLYLRSDAKPELPECTDSLRRLLVNMGAPAEALASVETLHSFRESVAGSVNSGIRAKLAGLMDMILGLNARFAQTDAFEMANLIWNASGLSYEYKQENTPESENRIGNVEELLNAVKAFCEEDPLMVDEETGEMVAIEGIVTLDRFLQDVALLTDQDDKKDDPEADKVTLMTVHAAKGLEFPYVFVVGCEENLFPAAQSVNTREEVEEERRLFYVAVTRAEKDLWLSFANRRMRWGETAFCEPSRFLLELDNRHIENPSLLESNPFENAGFDDDFDSWAPMKRPERTIVFKPKPDLNSGKFKKLSDLNAARPAALGAGAATTGATDFTAGERVRHAKFGTGTVRSMEGEGANRKVTVKFDSPGVGEKTLLTKFAKLEKI